MDEEMVSIPTSSRRRPLPEEGKYGPGLQWEADLQLWSLEPSDRLPGYDKSGEFEPYWEFTFRIAQADGPNYFVREVQSFAAGSGSKAIPWLEAAEVPYETYIDENGEEAIRFNKADAAPRKIEGCIEMAGPRSYTNNQGELRTVHGRILGVFGKE